MKYASQKLIHRTLWLCLLCCTLPLFLFSQKKQKQPNIIPNSSFEKFSGPPIGWFYKGAHYNAVMRYWFSATAASPDAYGPDIKVPNDWREKGFGAQSAHRGKAMTGLTVYGCKNGKPHCREYVEILMSEPLVVGQTYGAEFWVTHIDKSLQVNNLGMLFTEKPIKLGKDDPILRKPQFKSEKVVAPKKGKWTRVRGTFVADVEAEYLTLGNFDVDEKTRFRRTHDSCYNYAYYYFDDIKVYKLPPYLPVPVKDDDLTLIELAEGKTIALKDIYFEFDEYDLLPRSFVELRKLKHILKEHPKMIIEILGHTDNYGTHEYNVALSKKRAASCVEYLKKNGIPEKQLRYKGLGESQPAKTNRTAAGRQKNRRVEFKVIKL